MSLEPDPVRALEILACALREDLRVERAGIFMYQRHSRCLERVFGIDSRGLPETGPEIIRLTDARTPLMDVVRRERPYFFSNHTLTEYSQQVFNPPVDSLGVIPIIVGEELLGVLCVDNLLTGRPFSEAIREPLFLYAGLAALPLFALYQSQEAERTESLRSHIHREVLHAVTNGRMKLCSSAEMDEEWPIGEDPLPSRHESDVRRVRQAVADAGREAGMSADRAADMGLCASEAATNALLHGCGGWASVEVREGKLRVRIEDQGTGILPENLPKATLQKGWSSRASMGLGFTVMKETADRVLLATGPGGTQVIIEMAVEPLDDFANPLHWGEVIAL